MSNHPIVHIELSSKDLAATSKFYQEAFGWQVQQEPEMNYATFATGENEVGGGFSPVGEHNPAGTIMVYIGTGSIEESLKKVESLGAVCVAPKTEIPGMGWFAVFRDLAGNDVGLFQTLPGMG